MVFGILLAFQIETCRSKYLLNKNTNDLLFNMQFELEFNSIAAARMYNMYNNTTGDSLPLYNTQFEREAAALVLSDNNILNVLSVDELDMIHSYYTHIRSINNKNNDYKAFVMNNNIINSKTANHMLLQLIDKSASLVAYNEIIHTFIKFESERYKIISDDRKEMKKTKDKIYERIKANKRISTY